MNGCGPHGVEVAIIADDLTGAADCSEAFMLAGHRPLVLLEAGDGTLAAESSCDVVALSTNSRDGSEASAARAVSAAVKELAVAAPGIWFKKVDSTLRGHLGLEMRAVIELLAPELAIVCPAFPAAGRTLRDGRMYVHGEPLEETGLWRVGGRGGGAAQLPAMLAVAGVSASAVTDVRDGGLTVRLGSAPRGAVLVADADTDADLDAIVAAGLECGRDVLWVGSAGLAGALASRLPAPECEPAGSEGFGCGVVGDSGPVLVVAGSTSELARRQVAALERSCGIATTLVRVADLLADDAAGRRAAADAVGAALAAGRDAALAIEPIGVGTRLPDYGGTLAGRLGELVGGHAGRFGGLVLTGGDTARAVLGAIGIEAMAVVANVERGVPVSRPFVTQAVPNLCVVTKAGAFGDDESLGRAVRALHGWAPDSPGSARGLRTRVKR